MIGGRAASDRGGPGRLSHTTPRAITVHYSAADPPTTLYHVTAPEGVKEGPPALHREYKEEGEERSASSQRHFKDLWEGPPRLP